MGGCRRPIRIRRVPPNPAMIEGVHSLGEKIASLGDAPLTRAPMATTRHRAWICPTGLLERGPHDSRPVPTATRKIRTNADRRLVSGALGPARHHAGTAPGFT